MAPPADKPVDKKALLAKLPKVDLVLAHPAVVALRGEAPLTVVKEAVRAAVEELRERVKAGKVKDARALSVEAAARDAARRARAGSLPNLRPVINATGVVIHTNLGRCPLSETAWDALAVAAAGYSTLEYDLSTGERGSRDRVVEKVICDLTGAEAATVANNCAAAVLLVLGTLAEGREVVVSRGELVEIGGSFRIPDVMSRSGARLVEVGTTNRTRLADYRDAVGGDTALLMKVHPSNYRIVGFTEEAEVMEVAALARAASVPLFVDLGSGCLVDLAEAGLPHEPTVPEVLAAGADLVAFSGDKLLGGPQAGIICGRRDLVGRIRKNPLARALRPGKLALAALEATLRVYLEPGLAWRALPALRMMAEPREAVARRARALVRRLRGAPARFTLSDDVSRVGGGALPLHEIPTALLVVEPGISSAQALEERLRSLAPPLLPVIGRIVGDRFCLDLRTVDAQEEADLAASLRAALEA
jgi:L-seryl-tRNA(Ser) seleniumtransferase